MSEKTKARQAEKIREIGERLANIGYMTLREQALALGLSPSTTWTIIKGRHKASGLSARVINQMLKSPNLPRSVHEKIIEYAHERTAGLHGHNQAQCRRFEARLAIKLEPPESLQLKADARPRRRLVRL
jgi:hypothetical protein